MDFVVELTNDTFCPPSYFEENDIYTTHIYIYNNLNNIYVLQTADLANNNLMR